MTDESFFAFSDHSVQPAFAVDLESGRWAYANPAFLTLTGLEPQELSADSLTDLLFPEDLAYLKKTAQDFLAGTFSGDPEFRIRNGNGRENWVRVTPFLQKRGDARFLCGLVSDITAEVANLNKLKKFANKKNSILQILAHDLLGPLGIAQSMTGLLEKRSTDPEVISKLETIAGINRQAIGLIRDLTNREFLETSQVELVRKRIDLVLKLREYLEECKKTERYTQRHFGFTSSADHIFISLDESKFFQIINNLLTNSLKFTHEGDTISIALQERGDRVLITFSDTGIGIPAAMQPAIFDKFTESRRTGLHGEPTVGLGLSIVKTIVEWHNGSIRMESTENEGTTFFIEMPADPAK